MKLLILFLLLPMVRSQNKTRRTSKLHEPVDGVDIAFDDFPTLYDVLPTLGKKTQLDFENMPGMIVKNISIDIDKINIEKFRQKMGLIADKIIDNEVRMGRNITRRQAVLDWAYGQSNYIQASTQMNRRKALDCMLQLLYMARHKVKKLESSKYFNNKDTGFRIAYTFRRILRYYRKMMRIYTFSYDRKWSYNFPNEQIVLHGKLTRLHVDLMYLYWVLIKVDAKYKEKTKDKRKHAQKERDALLSMGRHNQQTGPQNFMPFQIGR